ncbi:MAG: hypothetical protein CMJ48_14945 [Planctomycetaceae bacterium]|nr:hypothetical protein [Planctomycetaceae bacterium]
MKLLVATLLTLTAASTAMAQSLAHPLAVAADGKGAVYVADRKLPGVSKIVAGKVSVVFQASKKFRTPLNAVQSIALGADGRLLVGDSATRQVYRIGDDGKPTPLLTNKVGIGIPIDLAIDSQGTIFVADLELHRLWKVPAAGGEPKEVAAIAAIRAIAVDKQDRVWVLTSGEKTIQRLTADGKSETIVSKRTFRFPNDIEVDAAGTAYVSDAYSHAVWKIESGKDPVKWVEGDPLQIPVRMTLAGTDLLLADSRAKQILRIAPDGKVSALVSATP